VRGLIGRLIAALSDQDDDAGSSPDAGQRMKREAEKKYNEARREALELAGVDTVRQAHLAAAGAQLRLDLDAAREASARYDAGYQQ
jgi:hypothetical protein